MTRQSRRSSPRPEDNVSRCAKDKKKERLARGATNTATAGRNNIVSGTLPLGEIVVEKQLLAKLALHNTSCAGCIASVRALLARPLSELRMVKAVVDEHGDGTTLPTAFRLKEAYVNDPKRLEQVLDTFPMSSVLKKVQPMGSAQRCQLHRRLISLSLAGSPGGASGAGANGGGAGRGGVGNVDSWDWEDAWERMPPNLRDEVATVKASALEAAVHQATDPSRFCPDCKYNVVQAHDILMGKMDLEGSENEEEYDEEIFAPFEDRVFEGESGSLEDKVLLMPNDQVEDLIYFHEDFSSQDMDSSCSGQQRHASTLDQGQREVRSILGSLILTQLRSVWHSQTAQVQGEQYLFCLVVDAVRTKIAAHGAAPHGDDLMAIDDEERCAAEERRQKRRQKRKERKRAGKAQGQLAASAASTTAAGAAGGKPAAAAAGAKPISSSGAAATGTAVLGRRTINGSGAASSKPSAKKPSHDHNTAESRGTDAGLYESRGGGGGGDGGGGGSTATIGNGKRDAGAESARTRIAAGLSSGVAAKAASGTSCGGFGAGGLAFQLGRGSEGGSDDDDDVDHDLITEMEQLKASVRPKSDIDFLRKTLRQNYDRFISEGAGRVR
eukprot:g4444.t1